VVRETAALRPAVFLRQTKLQLPHSGARRARCRWDIPAGRRFLSAPPEHVEMPMPRLVPAMEKGVISKWLIAEGDLVAVGDLVCEIDVEHLTSELPQATCVCPGLSAMHSEHSALLCIDLTSLLSSRLLIETHESGYLAKKLRKEGETVSVDLAIAVFCEEVLASDRRPVLLACSKGFEMYCLIACICASHLRLRFLPLLISSPPSPSGRTRGRVQQIQSVV